MPGWEINVPSRRGRLPGVVMAGFVDRENEVLEVAQIPPPAITMVFDLGDHSFVVEDGHGRRQDERLVAGLAPQGMRGLGVSRNFECLQIRLSPAVAHAVLGASSELGGTLVSLDELWGRDAVRTQERLREAATWDERFAIAEAALIRRLARGRGIDPEIALSWERMMTGHGRVRVERLADEVGWSRKRLWSRFRDQVGLTPKRAAQLIRFDDAAHLLAAGHSAARVAAESGYSDQSHLHRDVVAFSGMTPTAVAVTPFLAVDDVAWPANAAGRRHG